DPDVVEPGLERALDAVAVGAVVPDAVTERARRLADAEVVGEVRLAALALLVAEAARRRVEAVTGGERGLVHHDIVDRGVGVAARVESAVRAVRRLERGPLVLPCAPLFRSDPDVVEPGLGGALDAVAVGAVVPDLVAQRARLLAHAEVVREVGLAALALL